MKDTQLNIILNKDCTVNVDGNLIDLRDRALEAYVIYISYYLEQKHGVEFRDNVFVNANSFIDGYIELNKEFYCGSREV